MVRVRPLVLAAALPVATQLAPDARAQARSVDAAGRHAGMVMTDDELVALASRYNRAGRVSPSAPRAVTVFDVQDQTASAKLTAHWGTDSLLLAPQDGAWRVTHVLWQSRPHGAARAAAAAGR